MNFWDLWDGLIGLIIPVALLWSMWDNHKLRKALDAVLLENSRLSMIIDEGTN